MNIKKIQKKEGHRALILGVGVNSTSEGQLLNLVEGWISDFRGGKKGKRLIFTPNPEMLVEASEDQDFKKVLNSADINIPDGVGLQWASRYLASKKIIKSDQIISTRVTGTDMVNRLVELAAIKGYKVFLLGGQSGVAFEAKQRLEGKYKQAVKGFEIVAEEGPRMGLEAGEWLGESEAVIKKINKVKPELLFVGFGHKKQEMWLWTNKERLSFGIGMGVGGAFDFISGKVRRAPSVVRRLGLEWLFRLAQEPWRWRRQLSLIRFVRLIRRV